VWRKWRLVGAGGLAYREAGSWQRSDALPVLCLHGWPQSSYMWRHLLPALASAGRRALAPDLPGFGDSSPDLPGTWERHIEAVERFRREVGLDQVVLVVHDFGGFIGLRWACDHPDAVSGLVITNTGFFPDYEWHEIARAMRTPVQGEALVDSLSRDALAALAEASSSGIDALALDCHEEGPPLVRRSAVSTNRAPRRARCNVARWTRPEQEEARHLPALR
jgi:pimeloyl-ACP methyl ester carboxylesterase